jgi:hypothetical protein
MSMSVVQLRSTTTNSRFSVSGHVAVVMLLFCLRYERHNTTQHAHPRTRRVCANVVLARAAHARHPDAIDKQQQQQQQQQQQRQIFEIEAHRVARRQSARSTGSNRFFFRTRVCVGENVHRFGCRCAVGVVGEIRDYKSDQMIADVRAAHAVRAQRQRVKELRLLFFVLVLFLVCCGIVVFHRFSKFIDVHSVLASTTKSIRKRARQSENDETDTESQRSENNNNNARESNHNNADVCNTSDNVSTNDELADAYLRRRDFDWSVVTALPTSLAVQVLFSRSFFGCGLSVVFLRFVCELVTSSLHRQTRTSDHSRSATRARGRAAQATHAIDDGTAPPECNQSRCRSAIDVVETSQRGAAE